MIARLKTFFHSSKGDLLMNDWQKSNGQEIFQTFNLRFLITRLLTSPRNFEPPLCLDGENLAGRGCPAAKASCSKGGNLIIINASASKDLVIDVSAG